MINEKGYSWPESILSLVIIIVIFGTLLPFYSTMSVRLENKKKEMHAAEAAYHGAILYHSYGLMSGTVSIEKTLFNWQVNKDSICVKYQFSGKDIIKCLDY